MYEHLKEIRYDETLQLEAYRFNGVVQLFPNHFHEYYVIGLIESGERLLTVQNQSYRIGPGDMMSFHPRMNHACEQIDGESLRYSCLNIKTERMQQLMQELHHSDAVALFRSPVQYRCALGDFFLRLHHSIMTGANELEKEEQFLLFMQAFLAEYADFAQDALAPLKRQDIEEVCAFLDAHYDQRITLDMLSEIAKLNKYSLVRMFSRYKGITPYRYLETIRISEAKKMLEQGVEAAEAAQRCGFSDQSHFSSYFSQFIGMTPGQYQAIFQKGAGQ